MAEMGHPELATSISDLSFGVVVEPLDLTPQNHSFDRLLIIF